MSVTMNEKKTKKPQVEASTRMLDVPFVRTEKYAQRVVYLEIREPEASTLRAVLEGLEQRGAKLSGGKPVASSQDALRWILQSLSALGG